MSTRKEKPAENPYAVAVNIAATNERMAKIFGGPAAPMLEVVPDLAAS